MKEWISLALSIVAVIVSAGTFYSTILRQIDDLRLVVDGTVQISGNRETVNATPNSLQMTLINSGTREAAVTSIFLILHQLTPNGCPNNSSAEFDIKPFLLKEGEIKIIREMRLPGGSLSYKPCQPVGQDDTLTVSAYAIFDAVTPRGAVYVESKPLNKIGIGPHGISATLTIHIGGNPAQTLYYHAGLGWW